MLRELGNAEINYLLNEVNFTNNLRVKSKLDFNACQDTVIKAIEIWKQLNPILSCQIARLMPKPVADCMKNGHDQLSANLFCFFKQKPDDVCSKKNVFFVQLRNTGSRNLDKSSEVCHILGFLDSFSKFDFENELVWKIVFLKIDEDLASNVYNYCVLFTANHALIDGSSAYHALLELFKVIEELNQSSKLTSQLCSINRPNRLMPTVEKLIEGRVKSFNANPLVRRRYDVRILADRPIFHRPKKNRLQRQDSLINQCDILDCHGNLFASFDDMKRMRKNSDTFWLRINIEPNVVKTLLENCKRRQLKFNGCINTIILIALEMTYKSKSETALRKAVYFNSISLRNHLSTEEFNPEDDTLGYVSNSMYKEFELEEMSPAMRIAQFWTLAAKESDEFHQRIRNGEHFLRDSWPVAGPEDIHFHYFCSNLGKKLESLPGTSLIKVSEHYKYSNCLEQYVKGLFYCSETTINDRMFYSFWFSTKYVNQEFVQCFHESFNFVLNQIL